MKEYLRFFSIPFGLVGILAVITLVMSIVKGGPDVIIDKLQDILGGNSIPIDYNSKIQSDGIYKLGVTFRINGYFF